MTAETCQCEGPAEAPFCPVCGKAVYKNSIIQLTVHLRRVATGKYKAAETHERYYSLRGGDHLRQAAKAKRVGDKFACWADEVAALCHKDKGTAAP